MKFVSISVPSTREEFLATVKDNRLVNEGVRFPEGQGAPTAEVKAGKSLVRIRCRMVGAASRDNGFLFGTALLGRIRERDGVTKLRGVIVTEPILHLLWLGILVYFVVTCIRLGAISPFPILLSLMFLLVFRSEYRKQEYLRRYLHRAARRFAKPSVKED